MTAWVGDWIASDRPCPNCGAPTDEALHVVGLFRRCSACTWLAWATSAT